MKIYSMTATFGKLEHETLTLKPGLNIIEAPNEWGKSTWCAFLINMLYGIETRARTTSQVLADKERYAPWSGAPMSGSIDLCWNGRDITIQRSTKGRLIFGDFRAFETESGLDVPELTAGNCGQQLLGVERSVFTRAGFLKLSDLPVTQDDSLRRRLNALVTTGDDSGDADQLAQSLKDLKNRCRYNKTGLLPQAEAEREQLKMQLDELHQLEGKAEHIRTSQKQLEGQLQQLSNHLDALNYEAAQENNRRLEAAEQTLLEAQKALQAQEDLCSRLPSRSELEQKQKQAEELTQKLLAPMPEPPKEQELYQVDRALPVSAMILNDVRKDAERAAQLQQGSKKPSPVWFILALAALAAGACLYFVKPVYGIGAGAASVLLLVLAIFLRRRAGKKKRLQEEELAALMARYPGIPVEQWVDNRRQQLWQAEERDRQAKEQLARIELEQQVRRAYDAQIQTLTGGVSTAQWKEETAQALSVWTELEQCRIREEQARQHADALRAVIRPVEPAREPDALTYDLTQTQALIAEGNARQKQLQLELGQCQGRCQVLGPESVMRERLDMLSRRIARLEDTYYALELAQDALHKATNDLQRRFAPRIAKRAQEIFGKLTGGRYQKIALNNDLALNVLAENEDTLRASQWRSDGTVDQLYLALRLAVAEELTPQAPLVLDDALVRFDDVRLQQALQLLQEAAEHKQVILFTCQSREKQMI